MKNTFILLSLVVGFYSCNSKTEQKIPNQNDQQKRNINLANQYFEHFNNHDWEKMAEMYIESADFKDPSLGQGIVKQTKKEIIAKYSELNEIFPDLNDKIIRFYPSGDKHVIVEFISTGTAPDNSKFELPICTIFSFENGKITKDYTYYDNFDESEE